MLVQNMNQNHVIALEGLPFCQGTVISKHLHRWGLEKRAK